MSDSQDVSRTASVISERLSPRSLRQTASWIRNDLDLLVARNGPQALDSNTLVSLFGILQDLRRRPASVQVLQYSRIYLAVREIRGKATRWPGKLIDEADRLVEYWEDVLGPLKNIRTPLYGKGGRLFGICEPEHTHRDDLLQYFSNQNPKFVDDTRAYIHGCMRFKPGSWWINGLFAFRDGIINSACTEGGIVFSEGGAFAVVLRGDDEGAAPHPSKFTYRTRLEDRGRFQLTSADWKSRCAIRILRDHRLASIWAPKTGIRYDGLFKVVGWTIRPCVADKNCGETVRFDVHFESAEMSMDWDQITQVPAAEENDDYTMYKIIHREQRGAKRRQAQNIFESPLSSDSSDIDFIPGSTTRTMSICEVAGFDMLRGEFNDSDYNSGSDHWEVSKTALDGSSDRTHSNRLITMERKQGHCHPHIPKPAPRSAARLLHFLRAPSRLAIIEHDTILSETLACRSTKSYGDFDNSISAPFIDTMFRPVNWNLEPRLDVNPAFDLSDEELESIAPFSDFSRRQHLDFPNVSPKNSARELRLNVDKGKSLERWLGRSNLLTWQVDEHALYRKE